MPAGSSNYRSCAERSVLVGDVPLAVSKVGITENGNLLHMYSSVFFHPKYGIPKFQNLPHGFSLVSPIGELTVQYLPTDLLLPP